jgi:uncharacterized protein YndB with AHSA1/START domain
MDGMTDTKTTTLTRIYDAPASLVFDCCLKPEHLVHWYNAGDGWTTPSAVTDPKPGGRFNIRFQSPDPKIGFDFTGTYDEIVPPAPGKSGRIKYTIDDGRPVWMEFLEKDGKTYLTLILTLENIHSEEQQRHGWGAMLENLNIYLERTAA